MNNVTSTQEAIDEMVKKSQGTINGGGFPQGSQGFKQQDEEKP
jgi:hypothetical protein